MDRAGVTWCVFVDGQVCMRDAHMGWTEDELKNVFEHFDADGSGNIK